MYWCIDVCRERAKVDGGCDRNDVDKEEIFTTACVEEYGDTG